VALPFATSIARGYGARVYALHVFTPDPNVCGAPSKLAIAAIETREQTAKARIDSQLAGLEHETIVDWSVDLWNAVQKMIKENDIDLIVIPWLFVVVGIVFGIAREVTRGDDE